MSKLTKKMSFHLPGDSSLIEIHNGLLDAINLITCHNDVDQQQSNESINILTMFLRACGSNLSIDNAKAFELADIDNEQLHKWTVNGLYNSINLICKHCIVDNPEDSRNAIKILLLLLMLSENRLLEA